MKRKTSQARIEANRRNAQKSTGPRTEEGKARSSANAITHGLSSLKAKPLGPGCFLGIEDPAAFQDMLNDYVATYNPQHRDEMDLLREAVYAKFRQERVWHAETGQIEVAIAENERELQRTVPTATAAAHLANGFAHSESMVKLYLRYDAQLHRHFKSCIQQLNDLQDRRRNQAPLPEEPNHPPNPDLNGGDPKLVDARAESEGASPDEANRLSEPPPTALPSEAKTPPKTDHLMEGYRQFEPTSSPQREPPAHRP